MTLTGKAFIDECEAMEHTPLGLCEPAIANPLPQVSVDASLVQKLLVELAVQTAGSKLNPFWEQIQIAQYEWKDMWLDVDGLFRQVSSSDGGDVAMPAYAFELLHNTARPPMRLEDVTLEVIFSNPHIMPSQLDHELRQGISCRERGKSSGWVHVKASCGCEWYVEWTERIRHAQHPHFQAKHSTLTRVVFNTDWEQLNNKKLKLGSKTGYRNFLTNPAWHRHDCPATSRPESYAVELEVESSAGVCQHYSSTWFDDTMGGSYLVCDSCDEPLEVAPAEFC